MDKLMREATMQIFLETSMGTHRATLASSFSSGVGGMGAALLNTPHPLQGVRASEMRLIIIFNLIKLELFLSSN